jgi:hypothetical protein
MTSTPPRIHDESSDVDQVDIALAAMLVRISNPNWAECAFQSTQSKEFIDTSLDSLAAAVNAERWSPLRHKALSALRAIKPRGKIAVLSMARDEAPVLPEWIAHNLAVGVDRIFMYSNDNSDGTDELLRWFSKHAPVTPLFTTAAKGVNIQRKNYEHACCLLPELRLYEWVLMIDVDEFVVPEVNFDCHLPTFLDAAPKDTDAILFPWLWRLWDRSFERRQGLLPERYPHAIRHMLFKPVFRFDKVIGLGEVHVPTLEKSGIIRDTSFAKIAPAEVWSQKQKSFAGGWVDHYWGRSFEEFIIKKRRGDTLAIPTGQFRREYETFFSWTAPLTAENLASLPDLLLSRLKKETARFKEIPSYNDLIFHLESRYLEQVAALRSDEALLALHRDLTKRIAAK